MRRKNLRRLLLAASAIAVLAALNLAPLLAPLPKMEYAEGDVVEKDLYAPISFPLPKDSTRLVAEQDSAAAGILPILALKEEVETQWRQTLRDLRTSDSIASELPLEKRELLSSKLLASADSVVEVISSQGYFREKEDLAARKVVVLMGEVEIGESLDNILGFWDADTLIENSARRHFTADKQRAALLTDILRRIILPNPNLVYDSEETEARREAARSRVSPYEGFVERGELIVEANSHIDPLTLKKITALNAEIEGNWRLKLQLFIRQNLLFILILLGLGLALYLLRRELKVREFLYVTMLLVVGLAASLILRRFSIWWFVPTGFLALAVAMFIGPLEGILLAGTVSILIYLPWQTEPEFLLYALLSGSGALLALPLMHRRIGFVAAFGFILGGGVVARGIFILTKVNFSLRELPVLGLEAGINSVINFALLAAAFFTAERLFGFTSTLSLAELADLNRPMLKELSLKATGTYHHSILVGSLAERAARIIGANPALVLASGYYHDIGKMANPQYFIENQLDEENPHDGLKPRMSALILANHVKKGLIMAKRCRLPRPIRDIVAQHHGTTRMEYFYRKHLETKDAESVPEEVFRYPGPKPQTKEAALVMLADSVEAAVRAHGFTDREDLERFIKEIMDEKISDGQLDECPFTTADIHEVRKVFTSTLIGIFHPRISYEKKNNATSPKKNSKKSSPAKTRKKRS
ncbi:HDIG domain-containing protein [candidate division WOR-3 bacterium]|nr:HDIG domain-containing protein [candidate division WOR-3 bacterium]